jgi:hypothetical protein
MFVIKLQNWHSNCCSSSRILVNVEDWCNIPVIAACAELSLVLYFRPREKMQKRQEQVELRRCGMMKQTSSSWIFWERIILL